MDQPGTLSPSPSWNNVIHVRPHSAVEKSRTVSQQSLTGRYSGDIGGCDKDHRGRHGGWVTGRVTGEEQPMAKNWEHTPRARRKTTNEMPRVGTGTKTVCGGREENAYRSREWPDATLAGSHRNTTGVIHSLSHSLTRAHIQCLSSNNSQAKSTG